MTKTCKFTLDNLDVTMLRLEKFKSMSSAMRKKYNLKELDVPKFNSDYLENYKFDCAIMFSGGYDSLALTLKHLEKGERVALLSVCINPNDQYCAYLTSQILKKCYPNKVFFYKIFPNPIGISVECEGTDGITQQPLCTFFASFMPQPVRETAKSLEFAFILNDDAISYLNEIKRLYTDSFKFRNLRNGERYPPIKFPFIKTMHCENIEYVSSMEERLGVIFPTFSAEWSDVSYYKNSTQSVTIINCSSNSDKPNKKCNVNGYVIITKKRKIKLF